MGKKEAIALITASGYEGISSPVVNTALYFASLDYWVDIYVSEDKYCENLGLTLELDHPNITVYKSREYWFKCFVFFRLLVKDIEFCFRQLGKSKQQYKFLIGFDPHALFRAYILSNIWSVPYIYHSLEFYEKYDFLKILERFCTKKAMVTLTQDEQRAEVLSQLNNISRKKILLSYNSSSGNIIKEKKDIFRKKFSIPDNKYIVLFTGSIIEQCYIKELLGNLIHWPDDFVLVIHGWIPDNKICKLIQNKILECPKKIFLSTEILPFDNKYDVFESVDIGLVLFKPINLNLKYAAGSAGKLYDFMRTGVPVIANDIPGMRDLVELNEIGKVVKSINDIAQQLEGIMNNYIKYSRNSWDTFRIYEFSKNYNDIIKRVLSML